MLLTPGGINGGVSGFFVCYFCKSRKAHNYSIELIQSDSTRKKERDEIKQSQMSKCKHSFKGSEFDRNCILKQ